MGLAGGERPGSVRAVALREEHEGGTESGSVFGRGLRGFPSGLVLHGL